MNLKYGFGVYTFVFGMMVPGAILRAYVLAVLWRWFGVPLGLPSLGMAHAYGLATLLQFANINLPPVKDRDVAEAANGISRQATAEEKSLYIATHLLRTFVPALFVLAFGYAAKLAMGG